MLIFNVTDQSHCWVTWSGVLAQGKLSLSQQLSVNPIQSCQSLPPYRYISEIAHGQNLSIANKNITQGMVDGSASKPALRQDTSYMVEKTSPDIAPYLGAFGVYIMPQ